MLHDIKARLGFFLKADGEGKDEEEDPFGKELFGAEAASRLLALAQKKPMEQLVPSDLSFFVPWAWLLSSNQVASGKVMQEALKKKQPPEIRRQGTKSSSSSWQPSKKATAMDEAMAMFR